jgi:excisionase family DNA binding protein
MSQAKRHRPASHTQPLGTAAAANPLLTLQEAADKLRTPVSTLRYWRHMGIGPRSLKLGRRVLYRLSDLDAYIEQAAASGAGPKS